MDLLVLGASGRTGAHLVRLAAARGHAVEAIVRPGSACPTPDGVRATVGEVTDEAFVAQLVRSRRTVLSCLGLRRRSLLPWSRLLSPPDLVQRVTRSLAEHAEPDARVVWISAGGAGDSRAATSWPVRRMIDAGNVGVAYRDLEAAEEISSRAGRGWLAVRPVTLVPGAPTGRVAEVQRYGLFSTVRRGDVAQWMLDAAGGTRSGVALIGRP